nr:disease resistance protein RFL1-like [Coffea arabica]
MEKLHIRDQKLPPDVLEIARWAVSFSKKYGGLPLGIIAKVRSMIGANDIREWRDALAEMEEGPDDKVFEVMKSSFYGLRNERWKTCFLHCSILLKDETIPRDEVVRGLISKGLLDRRCREAKFHQGHTILKALVKAFLLDCVVNDDGVDCLKMHPLIRDMAAEIMKSDPTYMIKQFSSCISFVGLGIKSNCNGSRSIVVLSYDSKGGDGTINEWCSAKITLLLGIVLLFSFSPK